MRAPIFERGSSSRTRTVRGGVSTGVPVRTRFVAALPIAAFPAGWRPRDFDCFCLAFFRGVVPVLATALAPPVCLPGCSFAPPEVARFLPVARPETALLCLTFVTPSPTISYKCNTVSGAIRYIILGFSATYVNGP